MTWTGLPGFLDTEYFTNVWTPLPQHQLAQFSAAELVAAESPAPQPLSSGPFVLDEWQRGEALVLRNNPYYYRADAGLPHITELTIWFDLAGKTAVNQIAAGVTSLPRCRHPGRNRRAGRGGSG